MTPSTSVFLWVPLIIGPLCLLLGFFIGRRMPRASDYPLAPYEEAHGDVVRVEKA